MTQKEEFTEDWAVVHSAETGLRARAEELALFELEKFNVGYILPGMRELREKTDCVQNEAARRAGFTGYRQVEDLCRAEMFSVKNSPGLSKFFQIKEEMTRGLQKNFDEFAEDIKRGRIAIVAAKIRFIRQQAQQRITDVTLRQKDGGITLSCRIDGTLQPARPVKGVLEEENRQELAACVFHDVLVDRTLGMRLKR